jgi:hypothetical protein
VDQRKSASSSAMADDGEDDYLTMTFGEASANPRTETYSQRRARKLREHETRSHIPSPKVLETERREEGLATNIITEKRGRENKAMKMMKMMGYTYSAPDFCAES